MSGIKNIKKKLKGFQVRPPNAEVIKKVLLHIPYVVVFYVVNKCTWLYQYCRGSTVVDRLMVLLMNYPLAFKKLLPSIQPKSLAAGTIAAVSVWAVVAGLIQLDDLSVASTGAGNVVTGLAYDNKTGKFTVTKGLTALTEADFTEITQQEVKAMFA
ncbi:MULTISPECIES: hypothetical protein [Clostridia]|uniref:hypothetical protein n=1 Tax=Clostridia TaxID=186801 RepID=UPI000EB3B24D|nr:MULTISPECIES: hypothetical protein [Clostridia]RKQ29135.1 hypothetical protein D8Q48_07775 [Ruminococcus sp. B05]TAP32617.1 hypothetical protein EYA86_09355 [Mediterraneibacter sp. gm002]